MHPYIDFVFVEFGNARLTSADIRGLTCSPLCVNTRISDGAKKFEHFTLSLLSLLDNSLKNQRQVMLLTHLTQAPHLKDWHDLHDAAHDMKRENGPQPPKALLQLMGFLKFSMFLVMKACFHASGCWLMASVRSKGHGHFESYDCQRGLTFVIESVKANFVYLRVTGGNNSI